ncbi:hypothetical protein PLCT1_02677 [Planctomycetaceae bacterium]|nr:hypothetical protein PLCT1_02677 [Planctomycetaceae bacterium]
MSNQQYRKEEPEAPSREARLAAARARIDALSLANSQSAALLREAREMIYRDAGGEALDLQIKGMSLVIEEGNIYREEWIEYKAQMKEFYAGKREREPWQPAKGAISGATMVSASRQLEALRERRIKMIEDCDIRVGEALAANEESKKKQAAEKNPTPNQEAAPKEAPAETEATPAKRDDHAATAAA